MDDGPGDAGPSRRSRRGLIGSVLDGAGGIVRSVASDVAPSVVDAVDVNEVVGRVDIESVVDRIDLDDVLSRVDVQALIDRIDLDEVLARVDLDQVLERVDVDALIARVDLNRVLERVDVDALIARVDVDGVVRRVDIDAVVRRVDLDELLRGVDINQVLQRVDVDALIGRTELGSVVARSTAGVIGGALDLLRSVGVGLDLFVQRWVNRLLRRDPAAPPGGPRLLVAAHSARSARVGGGDAVTQFAAPGRDLELQGHYAGAVTRLVAYLIDSVTLSFLFAVGATVFEFVLADVLGIDFDVADHPVAATVALAVWSFLYFAVPLAASGRTFGSAILGLRVVRSDGRGSTRVTPPSVCSSSPSASCSSASGSCSSS